MKLLVNDKQIEGAFNGPVTLAGALGTIQDSHVGPNEVIAHITIDGLPLTAERLSIWKDRPTDDFDEMLVATKSRGSFAAEALRMIAQRLRDESAPQRAQISEHLGQGRCQEAMESMFGYLQVWIAIQQNLAAATRLMDLETEALEIFSQPGSPSPRVQSVAQYIDYLTEQLTRVKSAIEAGDLVLLGDIMEYEFPELTDTWSNILLQLADQFDPQE